MFFVSLSFWTLWLQRTYEPLHEKTNNVDSDQV